MHLKLQQIELSVFVEKNNETRDKKRKPFFPNVGIGLSLRHWSTALLRRDVNLLTTYNEMSRHSR